jgi:hypothetical protein
MKNMAAGKGGSEEAFKRFESTYSDAELKTLLAKMNKHHQIEEKDNRAKHAARMGGINQREAELTNLAIQKEKEIAEA